MRSPVQHPTPDASGDLCHPAFGAISASRISGGSILFCSDFQHNGYVRIRLAEATLKREYANDFVHSKLGGFVEVDMSEAQWAHFVSGVSSQSTPCTIVRRENVQLPRLPDPVARTDQFAGEADKRMRDALASLERLTASIEASGLSKAKQKELLSLAQSCESNISRNQTFVAEQFDEHMERTVMAAKQEVDGYLHRSLSLLGRQAALESAGPPPNLTLPGRSE